MVKKGLLILFFLQITSCGKEAIHPPLFIAGGQSNMALNDDGATLPEGGSLPSVPAYVHGYMVQAGKPLNIIPTAVPSTVISEWQITGQRFKEKIDPLKGRPVEGVIWWQGEADAGLCLGTAETYGTQLAKLIQGWRDFFNNPTLRFYIIQLGKLPSQDFEIPMDCGVPGYWAQKWSLVRSGQLAAGNIPNVYVIKTDDLTLGDHTHPNYAYDAIGRRVADSILANL